MSMGQSSQALGSLELESSFLMHPAAPGGKGTAQAALQDAADAVCHGTTLCMSVGKQVLPAGKGLRLHGSTAE